MISWLKEDEKNIVLKEMFEKRVPDQKTVYGNFS